MYDDHFSWIQDEQKRTWLEDFYEAIDCCNAWKAFANAKIDSPEMEKALIDINLSIQVDHSAESYMWTLKELHYIAIYGIESWCDSRKPLLNTPILLLASECIQDTSRLNM